MNNFSNKKEKQLNFSWGLNKLQFILIFKFILLFALGFFFFVYIQLLRDLKSLYNYLLLQIVLITVLGIIYYYLVQYFEFKKTIILWLIGAVVYWLFAIPLTLTGIPVSPFFKMKGLAACLLFNVDLPFRLLGIFFSGLIFIEITSPIEFTRLGRITFITAYTYRMFEHSIEILYETIDSLIAINRWPDNSQKIKGISKKLKRWINNKIGRAHV